MKSTCVMAIKKHEGQGFATKTCVGYFVTNSTVPQGWQVIDPAFDYTEMVKMFGTQVVALRTMNSHWKK
jgi:hypothetical protein